MESLRNKVLGMFADDAAVTTDDLVEALHVPNNDARTRAIRTRLKRLNIDADLLGYQTWVISD